MVFPPDHLDEKFQGKPKVTKAILEEQVSVWDKLMKWGSGNVVGKCRQCKKSQTKKDGERRISEAEAMGQEEGLTDTDVAQVEMIVETSQDHWCCMYRMLSLQDDFMNKKLQLLQHYLEGRGHICLFLPKFHCELNLIELVVWGYAKFHE